MKKIIFALFLIGSLTSFADTCDEYAKKSVRCYESGYLASSYDETGMECGTNNESIWNIKESSNKTIVSKLIEYREISYMGGQAWESDCSVSFMNNKKQQCSFNLYISLGTEDAGLKIDEFECKQ